ncbi:MAG TPA: AAA family ATPase, partial [Geobacteraceae bacterium]|nr:AAA family ATPase [Geobacteraceae bacterium]
MFLNDFVGQDEARLGLLLNAVDSRCGGLLLAGGRGCGKSTLARLFRRIIPEQTPFVELPLNTTEDSLLGGIDLEQTLANGCRMLRPGILSRAHGGAVFVDDINLLSPELTSLLMETQGRGEELIEREGLSKRRECRFTIIATMNPEEGDLSPHLADRFGLCALMEDLAEPDERLAVLRTALKDTDADKNHEDPAIERVIAARRLLASVRFSPGAVDRIAEIAEQSAAQGHRAELFHHYAARACAALDGRSQVETGDVDRTAGLAYAHRQLHAN